MMVWKILYTTHWKIKEYKEPKVASTLLGGDNNQTSCTFTKYIKDTSVEEIDKIFN